MTPDHPYTLSECIDWLEAVLRPEDRQYIENLPEADIISLHFGLGMSMRNNCGLWKNGCVELVEDIKRLDAAGYTPYVTSYVFDIASNDPNHPDNPNSAYHSDNASHMVLRLYWSYVRGDIGRFLIDRP